MNSVVIHSDKEVLQFALEEIYIKFKENIFIDNFDFIIFAISPSYPYIDIHKNIQKIFKTKEYFAFNSTSSISNEKITNGISALFIKFEKEAKIKTFICECKKNKNIKLQNYIKNNSKNLNLIFGTYSPDISDFIESLNFDFPFKMAGGIVSAQKNEDGELIGYLYIDNKIIKKGIVILTFENVSFDIEISTGYKPIGPSYNVTIAKKHKMYVIDYEDATIIGKKLLKGLDDIKDLWHSPILIKRDVLIPRTFKEIKDNLYIEFFGEIKNNDNIYLSFAIKDNLIEEDIQKAKKLKKRLQNIDLLLDFSCIAREHILKDDIKDELVEFSKITNAPLFGFFTFGELANIDKSLVLFNQTSVIIGIKE